MREETSKLLEWATGKYPSNIIHIMGERLELLAFVTSKNPDNYRGIHGTTVSHKSEDSQGTQDERQHL